MGASKAYARRHSLSLIRSLLKPARPKRFHRKKSPLTTPLGPAVFVIVNFTCQVFQIKYLPDVKKPSVCRTVHMSPSQ
jgi:hypothetical protein